jgi:hypothetical protein
VFGRGRGEGSTAPDGEGRAQHAPQDQAPLDVVVEGLERGGRAHAARAQGLLGRLPRLDVRVVVLLDAVAVLLLLLPLLLVGVGARRRRAGFVGVPF